MPPRLSTKHMTCKCGSKTIKRTFKVNKAGHVVAKFDGAGNKIAPKKVQPKKVQAKKVQGKKSNKGGNPCKCTNPFKK